MSSKVLRLAHLCQLTKQNISFWASPSTHCARRAAVLVLGLLGRLPQQLRPRHGPGLTQQGAHRREERGVHLAKLRGSA